MPAGDTGRPPVWKERREWLTAIFALVSVSIAVGGYLISRNSANATKALILVADKANDPAGAEGLSFVFHPLNQGQKILSLAIVFPAAISTAAETALPPVQELDLAVAATLVEHFITTRYPFSQSAPIIVWDGNIPVILEAQYVFGDESLTHRGLYKLRTHIVWRETGRPFDVSFQDVAFDHSIDEGTNYEVALAHALIVEEEERRKLFEPPR